jgi:hypothetical protein
MTVKDMIERALREGGFDGLYNGAGQCGCLLGDLAPCEWENFDCAAGYRIPCSEPCPADGDCPWHIGPEKPEEVKP